jgi:hypothetical protein
MSFPTVYIMRNLAQTGRVGQDSTWTRTRLGKKSGYVGLILLILSLTSLLIPSIGSPMTLRASVTAIHTAEVRIIRAAANPSKNVLPFPNFLSSGPCTVASDGTQVCANPCVTPSMTWTINSTAPACVAYQLKAINNARTSENLPPMVLPKNWPSLSVQKQLFVVLNLERTARGFPPYIGINSALSFNAQHAAAINADPSVARGFAVGFDAHGYPAMGGAWSGAFSVLSSDYTWMYDDGWGGSASVTSNIDCHSPHGPACWGHRDELLGSDPGFNPGVGLTCRNCEVGVGFSMVRGAGSYVVLVERPAAAPPKLTFAWSIEERYL